ncbi:MAG: hypothetical protein GY847_31750 [Proteobacteria bacterium]|nr:hypothetical protein [Pseudomonadota bacterium]
MPTYLTAQILSNIKKYWSGFVLIAVILALYSDILFGENMATGDHMVHLYQGWNMSEILLPSYRLNGWSHMAFAGYPAGVYYPILGDLLVAFVRKITFSELSWERTYSLAFLITVILGPFSIYMIARRFVGKAASLIAGLLAVGDLGGWPQGGHYSTVHWGVWAFPLSLTLTLFSLRTLEETLTHPVKATPRSFLKSGILMGLAALAHPVSLFYLGISCPVFVALFVFFHRKKILIRDTLLRIFLAATVSISLSIFWIMPWLVHGASWTFGFEADGFGGSWLPIKQMIFKLVTNDLFHDFYLVSFVLGAVGFFLAAASRKFWPTFLVVLFIVVFFTAGTADIFGKSAMTDKVQIERMAALLKAIWFLLAAYTAELAARGLLWLVSRNSPIHSTETAVTICLVVFIVCFGWRDNYAKIAQMDYLGGPVWESIVTAEEWLGKQQKGPLDRVLYQPGELCLQGTRKSGRCTEMKRHETYYQQFFASGPVRTGLPKLRFGYQACAVFKNQPLFHKWAKDSMLIPKILNDPDAMTNLHVRWIVSLAEFPKRHDLAEVKRFSNIRVYSVEAGKGPPVRLEGPGTIQVNRFSDENVVVRVEGAKDQSRILYPIAHYYSWHAYWEGKPIEISTRPVVQGGPKILMAVQARNGTTELRYERPWHERAANWMSLTSCVLLLFLLIFQRKR